MPATIGKRKRRLQAVLAKGMAVSAVLLCARVSGSIHGSGLRRDFGNSNGYGRWLTSRKLQETFLEGSTSAKESCRAAKEKEESDIAPGGGTSKCECEQVVLDDRYGDFIDLSNQPISFQLTCFDERCSYCSKDGTTCDRFSYGAIFEEVQIRDGIVIKDAVVQIGYFETNQYIVGRSEAVVYTEYNDPSLPGKHACTMEIDGLLCAVCEYMECLSTSPNEPNYFGMNVVCSNVLIGDGKGGRVPASDFQTCDKGEIEAVANAQGVFEMYDPDYGRCFSSQEACLRDKDELEQSGYYECACQENTNDATFLETFKLICQNKENCSNLQSDVINRIYSSIVTETSTRKMVLEDGRTVQVEETDCDMTQGAADECQQCLAFVDEKACNSCSMTICNGGTTAPIIDCSNVDPQSMPLTMNLCIGETIQGTPYEAYGACGFGVAKIPQVLKEEHLESSSEHCELKKSELLANGSVIDTNYLLCECLDIEEDFDAGTLLSCTTNGGTCGTLDGGSVCSASYNHDSKGVCFREELTQGFLADGSKTPLTRTTTYTYGTGLGNSLVGRTLILTEYDHKSCDLLVEGITCNSCQMQSCQNGERRPLVDCSNVIDEQTFYLDTCEKFPSYTDGLLIRLTANANGDQNEHNNFSVCSEEFLDGTEVDDAFVDQSLPVTCSQAQPIVLPMPKDSRLALARQQPLSNFAVVSFTSSTEGLSPPNEMIDSCSSGQGASSPGLWYSLVGDGLGKRASVCRSEFDAKISVYKSDCEDLSCVAGTTEEHGSLCDAHWFAEEGITYFLRVHGAADSDTGMFNLFLENLDERITDQCSTEDGSFLPSCLKCSQEKTTKVQTSSDPSTMNCQCLENTGTGGFHLTCVDMGCLKCNPAHDICGFETFELDIANEGSVDEFGSYESFYFLTVKDDTQQAGTVVAIKNSECLEPKDPYQQCMMRNEAMVESQESKIFCECRAISEDEEYMLLCSVYDSYEFCATTNDSLCATVLFGQIISPYGYVKRDFRTYKVDNVSGDEFSVERTNDQCRVTLNGQECSSCDVIDCKSPVTTDVLDFRALSGKGSNTFMDLSIDCSNVQEGTTFDCGTVGENDSGILSLLVGDAWATIRDSNEVGNGTVTPQTLPPEAFPPTLAPVTKPTVPPFEPTIRSTHPPVVLTFPENEIILVETNETRANETIPPSINATKEPIEDDSSGSWVRSSFRTVTAYGMGTVFLLAMGL